MTFRSYPDFGVAPSDSIASDIDIAELAARLGTNLKWRRDGRVLVSSNFSPGRDGWIFGLGTAEMEILASNYVYSGESCVHAWSTANPAQRFLTKTLPLSPSTKLGLEVMICEHPTFDHIFNLTIMRQATVAVVDTGSIRMNMAAGTIEYLDNAGAWIQFYTLGGPPFANGYWHNFKLVCDFENNTYVRAYADDILIPMGFLLYDALGFVDNMFFEIGATAAAQSNINCYLDNAIITSTEF